MFTIWGCLLYRGRKDVGVLNHTGRAKEKATYSPMGFTKRLLSSSVLSTGSQIFPSSCWKRRKSPAPVCVCDEWSVFSNKWKNCPLSSCFLTLPRLHTQLCSLSHSSLPELMRRHAARLRRFLSNPESTAAFTDRGKYPTPVWITVKTRSDLLYWAELPEKEMNCCVAPHMTFFFFAMQLPTE